MKWTSLSALLGIVGLAPLSAQATPVLLNDFEWVDETLSPGESLTVTHDFSSAIPDFYQAYWGLLTLTFRDNSWFDGDEYATIELPNLSYDEEIGFFELEFVGLTVSALIDLNSDGLLDVTVSAKSGSFIWKSSDVLVSANAVSATPVSEPGTLLLLGTGLLALGAGIASRRRARA